MSDDAASNEPDWRPSASGHPFVQSDATNGPFCAVCKRPRDKHTTAERREGPAERRQRGRRNQVDVKKVHPLLDRRRKFPFSGGPFERRDMYRRGSDADK